MSGLEVHFIYNLEMVLNDDCVTVSKLVPAKIYFGANLFAYGVCVHDEMNGIHVHTSLRTHKYLHNALYSIKTRPHFLKLTILNRGADILLKSVLPTFKYNNPSAQ